MSRRFFFLLAIVVLVGLGTTVFAASFPDVHNTQYQSAYAYLSSKNIVKGYQDGSGRPHSYLNRAEAVKVILASQEKHEDQIAWYQKRMPPLPLFADVRQTEWYAPYLEVAYENAIIRGYPDGTFRAGNPLTTEEAITLLLRAFEEKGVEGYEQSAYIENRSGQWFTPAINTAIKRNLVMHAGTLRLGRPITRGQFFDMLYRLMSIEEKDILAFEEPPAPRPVANVPTQQQQPPRTANPSTPPRIIYHNNNGGGSNTQTQTGGPNLVGNHPYASEKFFAISMPTLDVDDLAINHPTDPFSSEGVLAPLANGVGHLFSYPGGGGKIMIYGHSSSYAWDVSPYTKIFRKVNELEVGDRVYVTYDGKLYTYEVTHEQTIQASDTTPFNDNGNGEELILYTCWPPDSIAQRYLIHARPVDTVALR